MMAKKKSVKRKTLPVPKDNREVNEYIMRIGQLQREHEREQAALTEKIEKLKAPYVERAAERDEKLEELVLGLQAYAETHRDELTDGRKRKTVSFPSGDILWRFTPKRVVLEGVDAIKKCLKSLGLDRFIRTKEEIDKEAMLKEESVATNVPGVTITQTEEFVVAPAEVRVELSKTGKQKLKVVPVNGEKKKSAK